MLYEGHRTYNFHAAAKQKGQDEGNRKKKKLEKDSQNKLDTHTQGRRRGRGSGTEAQHSWGKDIVQTEACICAAWRCNLILF